MFSKGTTKESKVDLTVGNCVCTNVSVFGPIIIGMTVGNHIGINVTVGHHISINVTGGHINSNITDFGHIGIDATVGSYIRGMLNPKGVEPTKYW